MNLFEEIIRVKEIMGIISENIFFGRNLTLGDTGDDVKTIQSSLGLEETGTFDENLEDCVKQFQQFTNLNPTGQVDSSTKTKLIELVSDKLPNYSGCKISKNKQSQVKSQSQDSKIKDDDFSNSKPFQIKSNQIVGSDWRSCKAWNAKGGLSKWADHIKIEKNNSGFKATYNGPSSGISIAHANNGGDTIHQLFNVLVCEINPFLAQGGLKPKIDDISFQTDLVGKNYFLSIFVPFEKTKGVWQLDRRGGWGHDPGPSKMAGKCSKENKSGNECIGPITKVVNGPFGKITEYFITHQA